MTLNDVVIACAEDAQCFKGDSNIYIFINSNIQEIKILEKILKRDTTLHQHNIKNPCKTRCFYDLIHSTYFDTVFTVGQDIQL